MEIQTNIENDVIDEVIDEENNSDDTKIERYQINTFTQDRPIETLLKWYENKKLILPEFQREYVWSYANSSRLIESILLNLPIPNIFLFKIKDINGEKYILIDGLQRITTINQFVNGEWIQGEAKRKFRVNSPNEKWNKKMFKDLTVDDQQFIYDYSIGTTIFESSSGTELDQKNVVFSVFERINTGSEKLSDQEIRNAVYDGDLLLELKEIAKNPDYLTLINQDSSLLKRGKNLELILRFATYKHIFDRAKSGYKTLTDDVQSSITTSKKIMLNNYMHYANIGLIDFKATLNLIIEAISVIANFDNSAFCSKAKNTDAMSTKIHELFAEALVLAIIENDNSITVSKEDFLAKKIKLWNDEQLIEPFKYKTTDPETVVKRVNFVLQMIRG